MNRKPKICPVCGVETNEFIKGTCKKCYDRKHYHEHKKQSENHDRRSSQTKEIIQLYENGLQQSRIAERFKISKQRVNYIIKKSKMKGEIPA